MSEKKKILFGFTLIELIIVVIVIGILVGLALPQYLKVVERGTASKAKARLDSIRTAQGVYYSVYGTYATGALAAVLTNLRAEVGGLGTETTDGYWTYTIPTATGSTFMLTATRNGGAYASNTISITNEGSITYSATAPDLWK